MRQAIQFETVVESGIIRIPEQYIKIVPANVKVTLAPANRSRITESTKAFAGVLSKDDFSALEIDTRGWKFNREEANERR